MKVQRIKTKSELKSINKHHKSDNRSSRKGKILKKGK